jgi:hypothetical protein
MVKKVSGVLNIEMFFILASTLPGKVLRTNLDKPTGDIVRW